LTFWGIFSNIHLNENLDELDKFVYLKQASTPNSRAKDAVDSFPLVKGNYQKAIDALKSRFGREDMLIEVYVREMLTLVMTSKNRRVTLSKLYDRIECQLRALATLGVTTKACAAMLLPMVESCLPAETLRA
jgi:Protein of unknown function (DUF1759)